MKTKFENLKNNKIIKYIGLIISILVSISLYLFPNTLINSGFFVIGLFIFLAYLLVYIIKRIVKKQKLEIHENKEELFKLVLNSLVIGIFINTLFFLLMKLISSDISYTYSFGNYQAYSNATTWVYLLITVIILPLFNNLLLRRLISKFKTNKGKTIFGIILALIIFLTASTYISGIYLMLINLGLNIWYIKGHSLKEITFIESLIALILSLMTLYLSPFKILVILTMLSICIISLFINIKKEA